ncbi:MAG: hypothetical protein NXI24_11675 [bacterium]|nr:hypothetical protein [bacterium]
MQSRFRISGSLLLFVMATACALAAAPGCLRSPDCNNTDTTCNSIALTALLSAVGTADSTGGTTATWILVGDGGKIYTSPDALTWTDVSPASATNLRGVAHGAAGFVAVGVSGRITLSPTGAAGTWTEQTSGTVDELKAIAYDPNTGTYAAVGGQGGTSDLILTSTDGITWVDRTLALPDQFSKITYTGSEFVAVGRGGVTADSSDGVTWNGGTAGGFDWSAVAFGGGVLLAENGAGGLHTAPNRTGLPNATGSHTAANLESACYYASGPFFILGGDTGTIFTSAAGVGVATVRTATPTDVIWNLTSDGQRVIAAGGSGEVSTSEDGLNWSVSVVGGGSAFRGVAYGLVPTQ